MRSSNLLFRLQLVWFSVRRCRPVREGLFSVKALDLPMPMQGQTLFSEAAPDRPGQVVVVPIYYTPPQGVEVGSLKLEIKFVSVNLKYEKIEPGIAAETAEVGVSGNLLVGKDEKDVETSTLTVSASSPPGGTQKAVPSGLLAYLTLRISETGRPATITLHTKVEAAELETNKKLDSIRSADGTVEVLATGSEPLVSCFFFTH